MNNNTPGTLEIVAIHLAKVFNPLEEYTSSGEILTLLAELGIHFPESLASDANFANSVNNVSTTVTSMPDLVSDIIKAVSDEDYELVVEKSVALVTAISTTVSDFDTIADAINAKKSDFIADGLTSAEVANFALSFAKRLIDYLAITYIEDNVPTLAANLEFFGIIDRSIENVGSVNPLKPEFTKKTSYLNNVLELFKSPSNLLKTLYGWGAPGFDGVALLRKLNKVILSTGLPSIYSDIPSPKLDVFFAELSPKTDISPRGMQLLFSETFKADTAYAIKQDEWALELGMQADIPVETNLVFQPNGNLTFTPPSGSIDGQVYIRWIAKDIINGLPMILLGNPNASRLEAQEVATEIGVDFKWDGASKAFGDLHIEAEIKDGKVVIKPSSPDGFLAKILPKDGLELSFGIILGVSTEKGFYFKGSGVLQIDIPVSISLGPIEIQNLAIALGLKNGELALNLGSTIKTELGPFTAVVENMGMVTRLNFPENRDGNMGMLDISLDFKPPDGIGLSLDTGGIRGGGYLFFDFENERYAGAIELSFQDSFSFSAIGLITTRFPDGSKGFSLLILVNVEFATPIALGLNFYLKGVGGLIGLHRTIYVDELRKGVQEGTIDNIMFPENVIENISIIVSDLRKIFPPEKDQFTLGVMALVIWNVPPVISVELGLIIEFTNPVRIVILGVLKAVLPKQDSPIIQIEVNFLGVIDFEKGMLSFDASIVNSKILFITLEGDMALRLSWGEKKDFLLSVGGFHPAYNPPAHLYLPKMKRITISLLSGNPNLTLTSYFAITSNTVQFGAALDFSFRISKFGVYGHFSFDVLFQFSPFHFIANVSASVDVKLGSSTLFSIGLSFELQGPTPWRAKGTAKFKILFFSFKVRFDKTFGEKREVSLPGTEILPLVIDEFQKSSNWQGELPQNRYLLVTMRSDEVVEDEILIHAFGSLTACQNLIPLDIDISMFGNYIPLDVSKIRIKAVSIQGEDVEFDYVKSSFAPAAYKKMEDDDKLKAPSYEDNKCGIKAKGTDEIHFDYSINRKVEYEIIVSDYESETVHFDSLVAVSVDLFKPFVAGGDVGKSILSAKKKATNMVISNKVLFENERFTIVNNSDLSKYTVDDTSFSFESRAEADDRLKRLFDDNPALSGELQLVPEYELDE